MVKESLNTTDRETVEQIKENPYLQFFVGLETFQKKQAFHHSMMTHFRKRFPEESMKRINEAMVLATLKSKSNESSDEYHV